ncbi:hypothetical protein BUQ74_15140 [Leptospira weilii serovar Heyan]|uniref:Uncharacterized protein n=1 Tax=Leptospira weilii str. UI 13098 TaxID=1088542 RepID=M6QEA0_9LEPT|nr:hypothetical protein LEP1GSC108_3445 [Leptospira weilii str. UI 13098]OMI16504.1 hypothetical protein BUQ74_15140 [Leptospira weilii serovar Heyan]
MRKRLYYVATVGSDIEFNSEGIETKSAVASHFIYEICERFAQIFLGRTHVNIFVKCTNIIRCTFFRET